MTESDDQTLSFETALAQLETVVREMEAGSLPLEALIGRYERGVALAQLCRAKLEHLERKIELLTRDDGKEGQWTEFQPDNSRTRD